MYGIDTGGIICNRALSRFLENMGEDKTRDSAPVSPRLRRRAFGLALWNYKVPCPRCGWNIYLLKTSIPVLATYMPPSCPNCGLDLEHPHSPTSQGRGKNTAPRPGRGAVFSNCRAGLQLRVYFPILSHDPFGLAHARRDHGLQHSPPDALAGGLLRRSRCRRSDIVVGDVRHRYLLPADAEAAAGLRMNANRSGL